MGRPGSPEQPNSLLEGCQVQPPAPAQGGGRFSPGPSDVGTCHDGGQQEAQEDLAPVLAGGDGQDWRQDESHGRSQHKVPESVGDKYRGDEGDESWDG